MTESESPQYFYLREAVLYYALQISPKLSSFGEDYERGSKEFFQSEILFFDHTFPQYLTPDQTAAVGLPDDPRWALLNEDQSNERPLRTIEHYYRSNLVLVNLIDETQTAPTALEGLQERVASHQFNNDEIRRRLTLNLEKMMSVIAFDRQMNEWKKKFDRLLAEKAGVFLRHVALEHIAAEGHLIDFVPEEDNRSRWSYEISQRDDVPFSAIPAEAWVNADCSWRECQLILDSIAYVLVRFKKTDVENLDRPTINQPRMGSRQKRWHFILEKALERTGGGKIPIQQNQLALDLQNDYQQIFGPIGVTSIKKKLKEYREEGIIK